MNRRARASSPPVIDEEHRSARKRRAILEAATSLFLRQGYLGTSMDEIAALAAVSKQTVYKHFADKGHLFSEIVTSTVNEASDTVYEEVRNLQDSGDLEADLRDLARRQLALVMQPRILQLRRLVIGESGRFPELGRTFYDRGPGRTIEALSATFERLAKRGLLRLDDPLLAATHAKLGPNLFSRSQMSYFGPYPYGVASRSGTCGPGIGRRARDPYMDDSARVQLDDEEGKQRTEEEISDGEKVTRPDLLCMRL